jgi:cell wall-associated NlpC family hydrolase
MKKKFITLSAAIVLTLAGCSSSAAQAAAPTKQTVARLVAPTMQKVVAAKGTLWNVLQLIYEPGNTMLERDMLQKQKMISNNAKILSAVQKVKRYAGKTWYVFSGNTPQGWDCSGLVMWTYQQLGVTLEHRASKQARMGHSVSQKDALPGDVVAFYYPGYNSAYHVGIYLGNGMMIDAPRPGVRTTIEPVNASRLGGSVYKFVRILPRMQQPTA